MGAPTIRWGTLLVTLSTTLLLGAACWGGSEDPAAPTAEPTAEPTPITSVPTSTATTVPSTTWPFPTTGETVTFHPSLTRVGIPAVDAILESVEASDAATLVALLQPSEVACAANPLGIGAPPQCPAGTPAGTLVSVFPFSRCEEGFAELSEVETGVRSTLEHEPRLYAVHRLDRAVTGEPEYVIVFGYQEPQPSGAFRIYVAEGGGIVGIGICPPPATLSLQFAGDMILPPLS